jgi:hypothetical protein
MEIVFHGLYHGKFSGENNAILSGGTKIFEVPEKTWSDDVSFVPNRLFSHSKCVSKQFAYKSRKPAANEKNNHVPPDFVSSLSGGLRLEPVDFVR